MSTKYNIYLRIIYHPYQNRPTLISSVLNIYRSHFPKTLRKVYYIIFYSPALSTSLLNILPSKTTASLNRIIRSQYVQLTA